MSGEGIELVQITEGGKFNGRNSGVQPNLTGLAVTVGDTFTQTYSTAQTTVPAATYTAPSVTSSAAATTSATNSSPYGYAQAQADAIVALGNANKVDIAATNTQLAALAADVLALKKVITSIIDNLQTHRLVG